MKHASLRKPKHKELVVATSKGWVVDRTGEVLVRFRDLDKKLKESLGIDELVNEVEAPTNDVLNLDTELNNLINTISMVAGEKLRLDLEAVDKDQTEQSSDEETDEVDEPKDEDEQSSDDNESGDDKGEETESAKEGAQEEQSAPVAAPKKRGRPAKPKPTV